MKPTGHILPAAHVQRYAAYLREHPGVTNKGMIARELGMGRTTVQERAPATIQKYVRDLTALLDYLDGQPLTKAALIGWKEHLTACHAPTTVNSMLAALNGFLNFMGWRECAVKLLKIQKSLFCDEHRELTRAEYARLVSAAQRRDNERLSLVM